MRLAPHTLRWGCALARRTDSRRSLRPSGAFHGGISPGRFRGVWLHRSPPRPCIISFRRRMRALEVLTTGMRHTRMRAHATLLTLTPAFPSRPDPCGPALRLDFLSWDFQRSPLHRLTSKSPAPRSASPRALRGSTASRSRVPPSWFRTTSAAFSSPTVQVCCALLPILGFAVFPPVAKRGSSQRAPALRSFPSADSGDPGFRRNRGLASGTAHRWTCPSPRALPPRPLLPCTVKKVSHPTSVAPHR
jgi:hypothetical protein